MTDNIARIGNARIDATKQQFLDTIAAVYDRLCGDDPLNQPSAVVFAIVTDNGECETGYHTKSDERNMLYLARATMAIHSDYHVRWDKVE